MVAETKSNDAPKFHETLVRLVRGAGETLTNHAEEIVGSKTGTTSFEIVIEFPINRDEMPIPIVTVKQSYVSDEAYQTLMSDIRKEIDAAMSGKAGESLT